MKRILIVMLGSTLAALTACGPLLDPNQPGLLVPKTVDQDPTLPSIKVNDTQLHAETFGNQMNPMLVVLHGGPGEDYRSLLNCKDLASQGYFVVFFDQRGSGLSQRYGREVYNIQLILDDLSAVINHYRTSSSQKIFFFGHSWGAMLATAYINVNPSAISGAILAEPGGLTFQDMKSYVAKGRNLSFDEATNDVLYVDQFLSGSDNAQEILDYKLMLAAAHNFAPGNAEGIASTPPLWRLGYAMQIGMYAAAQRNGFDFTTNLHQYTTEILFMYSDLNRIYGEDYARHVSSAFPNVKLHRVMGAGHEMIHFGWPDVYPVMLDYLNSHK